MTVDTDFPIGLHIKNFKSEVQRLLQAWAETWQSINPSGAKIPTPPSKPTRSIAFLNAERIQLIAERKAADEVTTYITDCLEVAANTKQEADFAQEITAQIEALPPEARIFFREHMLSLIPENILQTVAKGIKAKVPSLPVLSTTNITRLNLLAQFDAFSAMTYAEIQTFSNRLSLRATKESKEDESPVHEPIKILFLSQDGIIGYITTTSDKEGLKIEVTPRINLESDATTVEENLESAILAKHFPQINSAIVITRSLKDKLKKIAAHQQK